MKENRPQGITLIEALVSTLIFTIIITSTIAAFSMGRLIIEKTKNRSKAIYLLQTKMEWIKGQTPTTIEGFVGNPIVEDNVDDAIGQDELINDTRTTTVESHNNRLKVTIILNWEKRGIGGTITKGDENNPDERIVTLISP